jgi:hypothetical protein
MPFIPDENAVQPGADTSGGRFIPDPAGPSPEAATRVAVYETAPMLTDVGVRDFMPETSIPEQVLASTMGVTTFDPYEFGQILTNIDPNIAIQGKPDGTVFATNRKTGKVVKINEPGLKAMDALQFLGAVSAASPAGLLRKTGQRVLGEMAIQAGIEGAQTLSGGEFNPSEVLIAGGASGVLEYAPEVYRSLRQTRQGRAMGADYAPASMAREATEAGITPEVESASKINLARQADVDSDVAQAAKNVGLYEDIPISAMSRNVQYQQLEQAIANMPGTAVNVQQAEAIKKLARVTDELIERFGGRADPSALNTEMQDSIFDNINSLRTQSGLLYDDIAETIPPETLVDVRPLRSYLDKQISILGTENLSPAEKTLNKILGGDEEITDITYGLLDKQRKRVGERLGKARKGQLFSDDTSFELSELYDVITDTQGQALEAVSPDARAIWDTAKGLIESRKALENSTIVLFGKDAMENALNKLGKGVTGISSGEIKILQKTMDAMPEEYRSVAAVTALQAAFTAGGRGSSRTSLGGFASWYENANKNRKSLEELYKYLPEGVPEFMDNLGKVAVSWASATRQAKPTGSINSIFRNFDQESGWVDRLIGLSVTGRVVRGAIDKISEASAPSLEMASNLMASQAFKRYAERMVSGKSTERVLESLYRTSPYKAWVSQLPDRSKKIILATGLSNYLFNPSIEDMPEEQER